MSRSNNKKQQQTEILEGEHAALVEDAIKATTPIVSSSSSTLIGGGVPKQDVWDDYSDSVYKSLLRMAAVKDLKKSKKKKEHQKTKVGAIRISKIALQDIEITLNKTRTIHKAKLSTGGAGRKSHAEHAILFYEHVKERLEQRLNKLQNTPTDSAGNFKFDKTVTSSSSSEVDLDTFQDYYDIIPPVHEVLPETTLSTLPDKAVSPTNISKNNKGLQLGSDKKLNITDKHSPTNTGINSRKGESPTTNNSNSNLERKRSIDGISTRRQVANIGNTPLIPTPNTGTSSRSSRLANRELRLSEVGVVAIKKEGESSTIDGSTSSSPDGVSRRSVVVIRHPKDHRDELGLCGGKDNVCVVCLEFVLLIDNSSTDKCDVAATSEETHVADTTSVAPKDNVDHKHSNAENDDDSDDNAIADSKIGMSPLVCSECASHFHLKCVRPAIAEIPSECNNNNNTWKCSYCLIQQEPKNSTSRRYAAKGVRLMARLRNKSQQRQQTQPLPSIGDRSVQILSNVTVNHGTGSGETEKLERLNDGNHSTNDSSEQSNEDGTNTVNIKDTQENVSDVIQKSMDVGSDTKVLVTETIEKQQRQTENTTIEVSAASLQPEEAHSDTQNSNDVSTLTTRSSKKRASIELAKLNESSMVSPSTTKRVKKRPVLYDPQACPASSWKSDNVGDIGLASGNDEDDKEKSGVAPSSQELSDNFKSSDNNVVSQVDVPTHRANILIDRSGGNKVERKFGKGKSKNVNSACTFCADDPDIVLCCFCSCRVCFGKHNQAMLLLCDNCDDEYHTYCLEPPLLTIPATKWFCPSCSLFDNVATTDDVKALVSEQRSSTGRPGRLSNASIRDVKENRNAVITKQQSGPNAVRKSVVESSSPKKASNKDSSRKENNDAMKTYRTKQKQEIEATLSNSENVVTSTVTGQSDNPDLVQLPRKRGRPAKVKKIILPTSDIDNTKSITTVPKTPTGAVETIQSTTRKMSIDGLPTTSTTKALSPGVQVSRSGRMVKRTNFHDEIHTIEQHLRTPSRSTDKMKNNSGHTSANAFEGNPSNQSTLNKRTSAGAGLDATSSSTSRKTKRKKDMDISCAQETTLYSVDVPYESQSSYNENNDYQTMNENLFPNDPSNLGYDSFSNIASMSEDKLFELAGSALDGDLQLNDDLFPSLDNLNGEAGLLTDDDDKKPEAAGTIFGPYSTTDSTGIPLGTNFDTISTSSTAIVAVGDTRDNTNKESSKLPRRKPGARECMQLSRKFGVHEIPQKYMGILLDYCSRGKVEHLIRMRERLDEHARFLESQLAGLESLVLVHGESDIIVPTAVSQVEERNDPAECTNALDGFASC